MITKMFEKKLNVVHHWHPVDKYSPALSDEAFWGDHPKYYSTIKPISFENNLYLIARDKKGLLTWKFEKRLNRWEVLDKFFPEFTDENRWTKPEYYSTIRPFTFNNELFLMARSKEGMLTYMFDKKINKWMREPVDKFFPEFADKYDLNRPEFYSTIRVVTLKNELFLLAYGKKGMITFMFDKKTNTWLKEPVDNYFTIFGADTEWIRPEYYSTIKTIVYNDRLFLMARDKKGLINFTFDFEAKKWNREPILKFFPEFSDKDGWNNPEYYTTIKPIVANNKMFLLARDKYGMITWVFDNNFDRWRKEPIDVSYPEFSDELGWNKPEYYSTISAGVVNNKFLILARDKNGMVTWKFDMPSN